MTEYLREGLDLEPDFDTACGKRVAQGVKMHILQPAGLGIHLEVVLQQARLHAMEGPREDIAFIRLSLRAADEQHHALRDRDDALGRHALC